MKEEVKKKPNECWGESHAAAQTFRETIQRSIARKELCSMSFVDGDVMVMMMMVFRGEGQPGAVTV